MADSDPSQTWIGLLCCVMSGICFGTMYAPLRKFETKDGFFVQWVQCGAIFVVGAFLNIALCMINGQCPAFQPAAALGGFIFATGNIGTMPVVNKVGPGLGMLLWGTVQIVAGWATARFGLFGLNEEVPANVILNYVGVVLTLASGVMFSFVKSDEISPAVVGPSDPVFISKSEQIDMTERGVNVKKQGSSRILYIILAICIGFCFGESFTPVVYAQDNIAGASQTGLDYAFGFYSGSFASATVYFVIYCIVKKNRPFINVRSVLPSTAYGVLWAFAMCFWFVSNKALSQAVSFPITTRLPGVIGSCIDVFFFKTITGRRNLLVLSSAVAIALVGVVLVGLSTQ